MNTKARFTLFGIALVALVCLAHTLDYREIKFNEAMLAEHQAAKFYTPYGETDCRPPEPIREFRVYFEWCDGVACFRSCDIVPRDPKAKRSENKKRVFTKS
jgi:hypothetical protein